MNKQVVIAMCIMVCGCGQSAVKASEVPTRDLSSYQAPKEETDFKIEGGWKKGKEYNLTQSWKTTPYERGHLNVEINKDNDR